MRYDEKWSDAMRYGEIWWDKVKYGEIWWDLVRYYEIWWVIMRNDDEGDDVNGRALWKSLVNLKGGNTVN